MREVVAVPTATGADAARRLTYEGWCVLDNAIASAALPGLRAGVSGVVTRLAGGYGPAGRAEAHGLLANEQSFAPHLLGERLSGAMAALFVADWRIGLNAGVLLASGSGRSDWRASWPHAEGAGGLTVQVPYGDLTMAMTAVMLLDDASGLCVVPGSHRATTNPGRAGGPSPSGDVASARLIPGSAGSIVLMDSRLWHADAAVESAAAHARVEVSLLPWWINPTALLPGLADYELANTGARPSRYVIPLSDAVFDTLPAAVQPLVRHLRAGQEVEHA